MNEKSERQKFFSLPFISGKPKKSENVISSLYTHWGEAWERENNAKVRKCVSVCIINLLWSNDVKKFSTFIVEWRVEWKKRGKVFQQWQYDSFPSVLTHSLVMTWKSFRNIVLLPFVKALFPHTHCIVRNIAWAGREKA